MLHLLAVYLANIEVRVGNTRINATNPPKTSGNALCGTFPSLVGSVGPITIRCPSYTSGRYVSIQRIGVNGTNSNLALCEVQVLGYKNPLPPAPPPPPPTYQRFDLPSTMPSPYRLVGCSEASLASPTIAPLVKPGDTCQLNGGVIRWSTFNGQPVLSIDCNPPAGTTTNCQLGTTMNAPPPSTSSLTSPPSPSPSSPPPPSSTIRPGALPPSPPAAAIQWRRVDYNLSPYRYPAGFRVATCQEAIR